MMLHNNLLPLFVFIITYGNLILVAVQGINTGDVQRRNLGTQDPGFISIDCGAEDDYFDDETGFLYRSDRDFISSGENHDVLPEFDDIDIPSKRQYKTLRSFPTGIKNCYALQIGQATNKSYFIRASFYYGNYDAKNQTLKFDLYMGVNYWTTMELQADYRQWYCEIFYVFQTDIDYVCLLSTNSGTPIISSLEIRPLDNLSYNKTPSSPLSSLFTYDMRAKAGNASGVRYKDDDYDRLWEPLILSGSSTISTSDAIDTTQGSGYLYKVPYEVLRTAIQPSKNFTPLAYKDSFDGDEVEYIFYFHFAEIVKLAQHQRRIFTITLNGNKYGPFSLEYLIPMTLGFRVHPNETIISFSIDATMDSNLPPILNALEIFEVRQFQYSPTDPSDVNAIISVKLAHNINRQDWQGDPCLPKLSIWSGLNCSFNTTSPRIISLNLSSSQLTGEIPSSLADLQAIESIDLSDNELSGPVPEVLALLPYLKILNLSGNKLNVCSIPQSLKDKSDKGSLLLSLSGNCEKGPSEEKHKKFGDPIVASIISALAIFIVLSLLITFYIIKRRKRETFHPNTPNISGILMPKNRPFTYSEIVGITTNFKIEIGEGGFGKVFLGHLNDDTPVAVKLLSSYSKQGYREFQSEAQLLMIIHHKNLVSLIGYCKEEDNMALVYEFMSNGNLKQHLSETNKNVLSWKQRLQIAVDAAQGLDYLHNGCKPPIVHRDLKTSNILLSEGMQAKIADFGLSRAFSTETASHISTYPAGTLGYLAPEYHASGNLNKKSDVFSFGVILFELITGQPVLIRRTGCNMHLLEWVNPIIQNGEIQKIVDPRLQNEFSTNAAWKAVEIAMSCVQPTSIQRPDMIQVFAELKECLDLEMPLGRVQMVKSVTINSIENHLAMELGSVPSAR